MGMRMRKGTLVGYTDDITRNFQMPNLASRYSFNPAFESFGFVFFLRKKNLRIEKFCWSIDRGPASTLRSVLASGGEYTPEITKAYFVRILILFPLSIFLGVPIHTISALLLLSCATSTPHLSIQVKHQFQTPSWILDTLLQNGKRTLLLGGLVHTRKSGNLAVKETFNLIPGCRYKTFASLLKQSTISEIFSPKGTVDMSTGKLRCKKTCFGKTANSQLSANEESARLPPYL